jgi:hypothetical protein
MLKDYYRYDKEFGANIIDTRRINIECGMKEKLELIFESTGLYGVYINKYTYLFIDETNKDEICLLNRETRQYEIYSTDMFDRLTITGQDILEFFDITTCEDYSIIYRTKSPSPLDKYIRYFLNQRTGKERERFLSDIQVSQVDHDSYIRFYQLNSLKDEIDRRLFQYCDQPEKSLRLIECYSRAYMQIADCK